MGVGQLVLEGVLVALLALTLLRAVRLDRALATLRRDHGDLQSLVDGVDTRLRESQAGVERLRLAADAAARKIEQRSTATLALRDDLAALIERGERVAERLEHEARRHGLTSGFAEAQVRHELPAGSATATPVVASRASLPVSPRVRSQAERELLAALQGR